MDKECWKPLIYRGEFWGDTYEVSNYGKIRNAITKKERSLFLNHQGYLYCVISRGRKRKLLIKVHRAVAENFIEGDKTLVINHKDCNKTNNCYTNLEFVTVYENNLHARKNGLVKYDEGCDTHNSVFSEHDVRTIRKLYDVDNIRIVDIAKKYQRNESVISRLVHRKSYKNI